MIYDSKIALAEQLKEVCPKHIAVAYIGKGWSSFIDKDCLCTVVVSPNLGSNPAAIVELAEALKWDNVWLLEELHSKIYIGDKAVMLGSANLSSNAFVERNQEEACVVLSGKEYIQKAQELFDRYVVKAESEFPDEQSKLVRIEKLRQDRNKAIEQNLINNEDGEVRKFDSYRPDRDGKVYI